MADKKKKYIDPEEDFRRTQGGFVPWFPIPDAAPVGKPTVAPARSRQQGGDARLAELARQAQQSRSRSNQSQAEHTRLKETAQRRVQSGKKPTVSITQNNAAPAALSSGHSHSGGGVGTSKPSSGSPGGSSQSPVSSPLLNLSPTDADKQRAQDLVDLQYGPQIGALQRALQQIQEGVQYQTDVQTQFGERGDEKLAAIHEALNRELNQNSQRIAGIYDTAQQDIGGYYDEASQVSQNASSGLANAIARRAETLGLDDSQADDQILAQLQGQLGNIQSQQATSRAGTLSNLESLGGNLEATAVKAISDAAREGVQSREGLLNAVQAAIADAGRVGAGQRFDVLGQLSDVAGQQGAAHRTTLQDLVEGRTDRERQSRLDMLAEELQRGALDIQRGQLGLSEQEFDFNKQIQLQQLDMQRQQHEAAIASASDPFARAQAEADLQKTLADIDKIYADINGTGQDIDYSGVQGIRQYLQDNNMPNHFYDSFNDYMQYARGGHPLDQLGSYAEELEGKVGGTVPFEQGMSNLINRVVEPGKRPIFNELLEIYLGKFQ